ncbi:MAG: MFS transporter [Myxococcales bacterium]|nr:MFS transporter [Myxococcales bacterium]
MTQPRIRRAFGLLWASETAFDLGSALMTFALGVWVFQRTGSAQQFSGAILATAVPSLLMTPVAGALADRFDRRWVIVGCDAASAVLIAVLALLVFGGRMEPGHLYLFNAASAVVGSIRIPAYRAAMGAIVPRERLTQASGLIGLTQSVFQVVAPLAAGYLMGAVGLSGVVSVQILLVVAGAVAAYAALSGSRDAVRGVERVGRSSIVRETARSFRSAIAYLHEVPMMAGLAIYGAVQEALVVLAASMMIPLVLTTHASDAVGLILSSGALGAMAGSALLVIAPVRRRQMLWLLVAHVFVSAMLVLAGFASATALWAVCAFGAYFGGAASNACAIALLLRKTPAASRGSIFALNGALNGLMVCLAMLAGGYLAQHVFEPALANGGAWASTVGVWVGTGKGRGLGFLFIACGAIGGLISLVALLSSRFRDFDEHTVDPANPPVVVPAAVVLAPDPLLPGGVPGAAEPSACAPDLAGSPRSRR